jgi:ribonuclease P protein component
MSETTRARFQPHERVRDPAAFRRAFERRRSAANGTLVVYAVENGLEYTRLGISVGRRKVRRAVARNRIKRLVREAFRLARSELPAGVDLIVVPRGPALSFHELMSDLPALARAAAGRLGPRATKPAP